jgi:hypothetical protein
MMRTIIHVHQQVIASNRKRGENEPPLTVKTFRSKSRHARPVKSWRASEVQILGPSRVIHSPHDPLPCGARVWIETESEVICDGKATVSMVGQAGATSGSVCREGDTPGETCLA